MDHSHYGEKLRHREDKGKKSEAAISAAPYHRPLRPDVSLIPPIRQTASIFKQPVTIYKNQDSVVKGDLKYGPQEKPRQLFWEKRLEGLKASDVDGRELGATNLPLRLKPVGPHVNQGTLLQSVATALHIYSHAITGQTGPNEFLKKNPSVYLNPDQPLIQSVAICDEDIKKQEDKVNNVRRKLQDAVKALE